MKGKRDLAVSAALLGIQGSVSMAHGTKKGDQFWNRDQYFPGAQPLHGAGPTGRVHSRWENLAEGPSSQVKRAGGHGAERNEVLRR